MGSHLIVIETTGETYRCNEDQSLLAGMESLGRKGIPVGCRNGGCGVCKIRITTGEVSRRIGSIEHLSLTEASSGWALACRTYPRSEVRLQVSGIIEKRLVSLT